jgi:hypothetical protein
MDVTAVITATIAAIAAIVSAYLASGSKKTSSEVERKMKIRQARMDERDLIHMEEGFLIPVDSDQLWMDYYYVR